MKRLRAFTFVELMIAVVILAILGGAFMAALWVTWGSNFQTQDLVWGRQEVEYAFQTLSRQLSNASLGMPNNRNADPSLMGSFANSFQGETVDANPIMAFMGANGQPWGGPLTVADFGYNTINAASPLDAPTGNVNFQDTMVSDDMPSGESVYTGTALYFAWAVPIFRESRSQPVRLTVINADRAIDNAGIVSRDVRFNFMDENDANLVSRFTADGRPWNLVGGNGLDMRSWVVFPTVGLPLLVKGFDTSARTLDLKFTAPNAAAGISKLAAAARGYVEMYAVQACRLYVNGEQQLIQEVFGSNFRKSSTSTINILARNVAGTYFVFDKGRHLLTMHIAVRGEELRRQGTDFFNPTHPQGWPAAAPAIKNADRNYRLTVQSMTWRIRN